MDHYAKFFSQNWWHSSVVKYGPAGFKFAAVKDDGNPLQSVLRAGSESQDAEIIRAFRSRHTVRWMLSTASPLLRRAGHVVLERFLKLATFEAASAKVFRRRLFYDRASWEKKFGSLHILLDNTTGWFQITDQTVQARLQPQYSFDAEPAAINIILSREFETLSENARNFLAVMKELVRGVAQEGAYVGHIFQTCLRQSPRQREKIFNSYIVHLAG